MTVRPSSHDNEWALYAVQYGNGTNNAPTGLVLLEPGKSFVDDFGVVQKPPPVISFAPVPNGQDTVLTRIESVVGDYTNRVDIGNRIFGPKYWETKRTDEAAISWEVPGIFPPGSAIQTSETYQERIAGPDTLFSNPTPMGQGRFPEDYHNPGVYLKQVTGAPVHFNVAGRVSETCVLPIEFKGVGVGDTYGDGSSQFHGAAINEVACVFYGQRYFQRVELNYAGLQCTHRLDYWNYTPTAWSVRGKSGPIVSILGSLVTLKGRFFDTCALIDLARGVGLPFPIPTFPAPPGESYFRRWTVSRDFYIDEPSIPPGATFTQEFPASPYLATVFRNAANDFCVAFATKMAETGADRNTFLSEKVRAWAYLLIEQFEDAASTGDINDAFCCLWSANGKSDGVRRQGWVGGDFLLVVGKTADVLADLTTIYTTGLLDLPPVLTLPSAVTQGTIFPPDSAVPTPLGDAAIAFITGDSQACCGNEALLKASGDAELAKYSTLFGNPLTVSRPLRTIDSRKLIWNDDLERWEMLQHDRNASGWGPSASTSFGPETTLVHDLLRRGIPEVFIIKCAAAGACLAPENGIVFSDDADESLLQTITVTATIAPTSTGATITAAPGTFSGVTAPTGIKIAGSLFIVGSSQEPNFLSQTGVPFSVISARRSGNNTYRDKPLQITSVSPDGSQITVNNSAAGGVTFAFNAETRSFTFTIGKFSLRVATAATVQRAKDSLRREHRLTPRLLMTAGQYGDNDTNQSRAAYRDLEIEHASWMRSLFEEVQETNPQCPPHAIVKTSPHIYVGTDQQLADIRAAQEDAAQQVPNSFVVETKDLTIRFEPNNDPASPWPPLGRDDNGIHLVSGDVLKVGWRIGNGLDQFDWFPQRAVEIAEEINPGGTDYFGLVVDPGDEVSAPVVVAATPESIIAAIDAAILSGANCLSYTVNGRVVELRSFDDLLKARDKFEEVLRRTKTGIRKTTGRFSQ